MSRNLLRWLLGAMAVAVTMSLMCLPATATDPVGFTSTTLASGPFGPLDVSAIFLPDSGQPWLAFLKTKRKSDGYVLNNVWDPAGTTGWHTHPGPTLIIVTAGAITHYDGDDPTLHPARLHCRHDLRR